MKSPTVRWRPQTKSPDELPLNMQSKEIGIFNIHEENTKVSPSQSQKEIKCFNSPTPDLSHSQLDVGLEDIETKTQDAKASIINIDIDIKKNSPKVPRINLPSDKNNSLGSNEEVKVVKKDN